MMFGEFESFSYAWSERENRNKRKKNPKTEKTYFFKLALSNFFAIKGRFYNHKKD